MSHASVATTTLARLPPVAVGMVAVGMVVVVAEETAVDSEEAQVAEVRYSAELELAPGPEMLEMMDFEIWRQHREELMREAVQDRLAKTLWDCRKRRGSGRGSSLVWEPKRIAGRLYKPLRTLGEVG